MCGECTPPPPVLTCHVDPLPITPAATGRIMSSDYEIRIVNGRLLINGSPAMDYLDCLDRSYTTATDLQVEGELRRVVGLAFRAGGEADSAERSTMRPSGSRMMDLPGFGSLPFAGDVD